MRRIGATATVAVVLGSSLLVSAYGAASSTTRSTPPTAPGAALTCAEHMVATWSSTQLVDETVAVSINAMNVGALAPAARAGYGAILLFGNRAPTSLSAILRTLQRERADGVTTLVMTDAEGGGVERLGNVLAPLPWAQTMGKNLSDAQITAEGARLGRTMRGEGLNVDLAPVADLDARAVVPSATDADGLRAFGDVPATVSGDAVAFEMGLESAGVLGTIKHFPGLGGASMNTDYGPAHTLNWSTLTTSALSPYRAALAHTNAMVMVSNASVPGLTPLPASVSSVVMNYLRSTMHYGGLIMTDSLSAGALSARHLSVSAASVEALIAGADLVLAGNPTSPAAALVQANATANAIEAALADSILSRATLQLAAAHVVAARSSLNCAG